MATTARQKCSERTSLLSSFPEPSLSNNWKQKSASASMDGARTCTITIVKQTTTGSHRLQATISHQRDGHGTLETTTCGSSRLTLAAYRRNRRMSSFVTFDTIDESAATHSWNNVSSSFVTPALSADTAEHGVATRVTQPWKQYNTRPTHTHNPILAKMNPPPHPSPNNRGTHLSASAAANKSWAGTRTAVHGRTIALGLRG